MKFTTTLALGLSVAADVTLAARIPQGPKTTCPPGSGSFKKLSAQAFMDAATPGWNLGNTLDAVPDEGSWNNPIFQADALDVVKAAGFKSVRIPVTYSDHFLHPTSLTNHTISPAWLDRVSSVIDMATSRGLLVVTNMHHDSWAWADISSSGGKNTTLIREKFYSGWLQIATRLACKPSTVAFEPINEPPGSTVEDAEQLMGLNDLFIQALKDSGGYNKDRVVTLSALNMGGADRLQNGWFRIPKGMTNPWAFQFHYYSPYDFVFQAWGKTVWGSESDKAAVVADLEAVRGNLTAVTGDAKIPIYLGEFDASQLSLEAAARWRWFDTVVTAARRLGIVPVVWDNGLDNLQRETGRWRDEVAVEIIVNGMKGKKNSLPESTTDGGVTTQESSAYVFNKVGEDIAEGGRNLSFALNGNRFKTLSVDSVPLKSGKDYTTTPEGTVTLKKEFLGKYLNKDAAPGTKANITVTFSAGAKSQVEIVQWDLPVPAQTSSSASAVPAGQDLSIPVVWKGLHRVAAVKMIKADGSYLFDDWTMWLPELQKGRGTYGGQWDFDFDKLIIRRQTLDAVIASGQSATLTFEFYPRAAGNGNYLNYTLTV
ncbi:glycoside hydrolase superfamily [Sordaria brevicollis]|uniref:Glycoside hydrolase superfamily n=1 Tax=Sordaria brevicollis TaxID=83679 RepID=A0AAE0PP51_SORBR|nr:glycoside hydrolase superfamily [Sordaria brevicollis]